jgi:hypothetical protein
VYVDQNSDGTKGYDRVFIPVEKTSIALKEDPKIDSATGTKNLDTSASTAQAVNKSKEEPKKEEAKKWWQISIGKNITETAAKEDAKNHPATETKKFKHYFR